MKILVTGGKGFIGTNLVAALEKEEHEVESFDLVEGLNCNNLHELEICMKGKDVVYHLANIPDHRTSYKRPNEIIHNNFISTLNVVECCRLYDVKMIFASSFAVYGNQCVPWREDQVMSPRTPYGVAKMWSEQLLNTYRSLYGVSIIVLRLSNVYGQFQELHKPLQVIPLWLKNIKENKPLAVKGGSLTTRDFTHIDDIINGFISALGYILCFSRYIEAINLCTGKQIKLISVAEKLSENLIIDNLPGWEATAWWGDNSKAKRLMGWEPKKDFWTELKKMKEEALNDTD